MHPSVFAQWLNTTFADFDRSILHFYHELALVADPILNPICRFLAIIGDGALLCFILAAVLILFSYTRKSGICIAFSVGIAALITNVTVKPLVARPRPYVSDCSEFVEWWEFVGMPTQSEYSFPSGHMTAAMAGMTAVCLCLCAANKKNRWVIIPACLYVTFMGASRNYLMVHYPTDIIGGAIAGGIGGLLGFLLINSIYKRIENHPNNKFCKFLLVADIENLFTKR